MKRIWLAVLLADVVETNHVRAKEEPGLCSEIRGGRIAALLCHVVRGMEEAIGVVTHFDGFPAIGIKSA